MWEAWPFQASPLTRAQDRKRSSGPRAIRGIRYPRTRHTCSVSKGKPVLSGTFRRRFNEVPSSVEISGYRYDRRAILDFTIFPRDVGEQQRRNPIPAISPLRPEIPLAKPIKSMIYPKICFRMFPRNLNWEAYGKHGEGKHTHAASSRIRRLAGKRSPNAR
jgi:hypothetical protein